MKKLPLVLFVLLLGHLNISYSQSSDSLTMIGEQVAEVKGQVEGMNETLLEMKSTLDALKKIKISGYIQTQFQSAQKDGISSFSGGSFGSTLHNRIAVRRGRLKVTYDNDITQYVLQIDAIQSGVTLKDAYVAFKEPWLKTFGLTGGVFDRPFGFEISYSSSQRESPERSRLFQSLFPGERDLGFKLEIMPQSGPLSYFNFKGGLFAGNGINVENDNNKDFIGRLGFAIPFYNVNLAVDGGVSLYAGKVRLPNGFKTYTVDNVTKPAVDSLTRDIDRSYLGIDLQLYYDIPVLGGFTLRGELITGKQPGTSSSNTSFTTAPAGDIYLRNFMGYYFMYVQNIGLKNQVVVKYDVYDPNNKVSGDEIGQNSAAKLGAADLKYSTLGLGLVHYWDDNVKFVLYYDMVKNETTNKIASYKEDIKDNVFTFRIQYKF
jgi:hypothetical protein